jgi:DNA gyrase subunit A
VRLAQDFNMRYALVDGQGNFRVDRRETRRPPCGTRRARLQALSDDVMADLTRRQVDFVPNYDERPLKSPP